MDDPIERQRQLAHWARVRGGVEGIASAMHHEEQAARMERLSAARQFSGGDEDWWMLHADCIDADHILGKLSLAPVNLIVTSPPYADARRRQYGGPHPNDYVNWFLPMARELRGVLAEDGSFVLNLKERVVDGERHSYVHDLVQAMRGLGFLWTEEYIWRKTNSMPGYWPNRLRDGWEHLFHFTKSRKFKMNQDAVRVPVKESTKKRLQHLNDRNDIVRHESATGSGFGKNISNWAGKELALPDNVLESACVTKDVGHPAAFPANIPEFFIKLLSDEGDIVFDPFAGVGTTVSVAWRLGRVGVGMEVDAEYYKRAVNRLRFRGQWA